MKEPQGDVTCLLRAWQTGDDQALEHLMPLVYDHLRHLAGRYLRREQPGHTLQPTALVNEAYLRLARSGEQGYADRVHFFAVAARVMRHILLDWAKTRTRDKRGGGLVRKTLEEHLVATTEEPEIILDIDRLLHRLETFDERKVRIVEMIFFAGMTYDETAEAIGLSVVTVHRELKMAKAWMRSELVSDPASLSK